MTDISIRVAEKRSPRILVLGEGRAGGFIPATGQDAIAGFGPPTHVLAGGMCWRGPDGVREYLIPARELPDYHAILDELNEPPRSR